MSEEVVAPFTDDQVASLNAYQAAGFWHPFTCGTDGCRAVLRAGPNGWRCQTCGYQQAWAHAFMADWSWQHPRQSRQRAEQGAGAGGEA